MRRLDQLITQARKDTENVEFTDSTGIDDESFIDYANRAQDRIYSLIQLNFPDVLQDEATVSAVANQEAYSFPRNVYLSTRVDQIDYSPTGNANDYYVLDKGHLKERLNGNAGDPVFYIRRSNQFLVQPKPQSAGVFRLVFQKEIPKLDIRRAKVLSVTLGASTITSLTLDTTETLDADTLNDYLYLTVVSPDGVVQMRDVAFTSVNSTTGVVTVSGSFSFQSGETISVGDYICAGKFSTTHSYLPDVCERYLLAYMDFKAYHRDSNNDSREQSAELAQMEQDIVASFSQPDSDVSSIPIITNEYLYSD